jgi:hypothetical protein
VKRICSGLLVFLFLFLAESGISGPFFSSSLGQAANTRSIAEVKPSEKHFTPVGALEKRVAEEMNQQRKRIGLTPLEPDWDLFRFARREAEKLASGKSRRVKPENIERLMHSLGRGSVKIDVQVLHLTAEEVKNPDQILRQWRNQEQISMDREYSLTGVGQASLKHDKILVILYGE